MHKPQYTINTNHHATAFSFQEVIPTDYAVSMFYRIIDDHLALKLMTERDAEEAYALIDRDREHLGEYLPWVDKLHSVENERKSLAVLGFDPNGKINCFLTLDGRIIGAVGPAIIDRGAEWADIGYWIGSEWEGRGYVTTGVREVERLCFINLGLERVQITNDVTNVRSRAIPERLGYTFEGILRHHLVSGHGHVADRSVYSILKSEWMAREGLA